MFIIPTFREAFSKTGIFWTTVTEILLSCVDYETKDVNQKEGKYVSERQLKIWASQVINRQDILFQLNSFR